MTAYGGGEAYPLVGYPVPITPPTGHGSLAISISRGPYIVPVASTSRLKIDGRDISKTGEQTFVAVPAGPHQVKLTDFLGMPLMSTELTVHPGAVQQLSFSAGAWRNRVYDGQGADVTKFGMWSNYTILAITLAVLLVVCCGGFALLAAVSSTQ